MNRQWFKNKQLIFILGALVLIAAQCTFKNLNAPNWDVVFRLPLINRTYEMGTDIVEDSKDLTINPQNEIIYSMTDSIERFEVRDYLKTEGAQKNDLPILLKSNMQPGDTQTDNSDFLIDGYQIIVERAILADGEVNIYLDNQSDYDIDVDITVPSLKYQNGSPILEHVYNLQSGNQRNVQPIPLNGVEFTPQHSAAGNTVTYQVQITVNSVHGNAVGLQNVFISFTISTLYFEKITGWLDQKEIPIDSVDTELNIPAELQGIELQNVDMQIDLFNSVTVPADLQITVKGTNEKGETDSVVVSQPIDPGLDTIFVNGLQDVINLIPENLEIYGKAILGDGYFGDKFTLQSSDYMEGEMTLDVPIIFNISQNKENKMQVDTIEGFSDETRDLFETNLKNATLNVNTKNRFPFGVSAKLFMSNTIGDSTIYEDGNADFTKELSLDACGVGASSNPNYSRAVDPPTANNLPLTLTEEEFEVFAGDTIYMGLLLTLPQTQGMVMVHPEDYIEVIANVEVKVNTTIPEDDDEEGGAE